nr:hypothetical protein [Tanacetum cinerariifolium]
MATNGNGDDVPPAEGGDLPVPDLRTMEELCQPTLNGRAIVGQTQNVYAAGAYNQGGNSYQPQAGSENRPPMLNKENYVTWLSRLLRYAKSRPNINLIHNFIINGPYVRRMIPEPGDPNREEPVNETFHVQTNDELTEK